MRIHAVSLLVAVLAAEAAQAVTLSGRVLAPGGTAAAAVNIDLLDASGTSIPLTGDTTNAQGQYSITVPAGTWDIIYKAPAGSGWASFKSPDVVVAGTAVARPDVQLLAGITVTGLVKDAGGAPVANADMDVMDCVTGDTWPTPNDNTNASGRYTVVIPAGSWALQAEPAVGVRLAPVTAPCAAILAAGEQPLITLPAAVQVTGTVQVVGGAAVVDANTSFYDEAGAFITTVSDHSDAGGVFRTMVVPGTYDIRVRPPAGQALVAVTLENVRVLADTDVGVVTLVAGHLVTGLVKSTQGIPLAGVDTDWVLPTGTVTTPSDNTDATGHYSVVLPSGTYVAGFDPPAVTRRAGVELAGVQITGNTALPDVVLPDAGLISGRVVTAAAQPVVDANTLTRDAATQLTQRTPGDHSGLDGRFVIAVVPGTYDVSVYPPLGSTLASRRVAGVTIANAGQDADLGDIVLGEGIALGGRLVRENGTPVVGVDLDARNPTTGELWPLTGDTSGADGRFSVRIPAGTWDLELYPAAPLTPRTLFARSILAATELGDIVLYDVAVDPDADGVPTTSDNCASVANATQADMDGDAVGDACDKCRIVSDPGQADADGNGVSDACEFVFGDIVVDQRVSVADCVKALRVSVDLDPITPEILLHGNVWPATVVTGTPDVLTPTLELPRILNIQDVVQILRAAVGLTAFAAPR